MIRYAGVIFGTAAMMLIYISINFAPLSRNLDGKNLNHTISSSSSNSTVDNDKGDFAPHWEYDPFYVPYMGNLSCIFEVGYWNLDSQVNPYDYDRRHNCGQWRYKPHKDWKAPDIATVFEKLPHKATIHIVGDSIGTQQSVDLLCYMMSAAKIVMEEIVVDGRPSGSSRCYNDGACHPDPRPHYTGMGLNGATFRYNNKDIRILRGSGNFGVFNKGKALPKWHALIGGANEGDIFVFNGGLHYPSDERLAADLETIKPWILEAQERGVNVIWRETNAAHFNVSNGYYSPELKEYQDKGEAYCVSSSHIDANASWHHYNGKATPLLQSWGIPVLETWEATFLMPEWCHVGRGVDCAHYLQPGGSSYFTEALLKYIEEM